MDIDLNDLSTVSGMVASEDEKTITVFTVDGEGIEIARDAIAEIHAATEYIMPEGLLNAKLFRRFRPCGAG